MDKPRDIFRRLLLPAVLTLGVFSVVLVQPATAQDPAPETIESSDHAADEESEPPEIAEGFVLSTARWVNRTVMVCWENSERATAEERRQVRLAAKQWSSVASISFEGWRPCQEDSPGIRIEWADVGPHVKGLGDRINGLRNGMVLNRDFVNWCSECQSDRLESIFVIAVHEFGHSLGLAHEQNRADTPDWCTDDPQGTDGDTIIGPWDPASVMNYCNPEWAGGGSLSAGDKAAAAYLYPEPPTCAGHIATHVAKEDRYTEGTSGDDVIIGTNGRDDIAGLGGDDIVCALAGDDRIWGDTGADSLFGGPGADRVFGGVGTDKIRGGAGADDLYGQGGDDYVNGDAGHDKAWGGAGSDRMLGGAGQDSLYGEDGRDSISGGEGNDRLEGGNNEDSLFGDGGRDVLRGDVGNDRLAGGQGDDTIIGGAGNDRMWGNAGTDRCNGSSGNNIARSCEQVTSADDLGDDPGPDEPEPDDPEPDDPGGGVDVEVGATSAVVRWSFPTDPNITGTWIVLDSKPGQYLAYPTASKTYDDLSPGEHAVVVLATRSGGRDPIFIARESFTVGGHGEGVRLVSVGSTSATVAWDLPSDPTVTGANLWVNGVWQEGWYPRGTTSGVVMDLQPATTYRVTVKATRDTGATEIGTITVTTTP